MVMEQAASQSQSEIPRQVVDLWFSPNIIVIRVEDRVFRVYSDLLAARSSVFQDMIAFPPPQETNSDGNSPENMDGYPVVQLHDKAVEVEVFLRAIYDSSSFMPSPAPVDMKDVLAILRLSHKYDVPYLHRRALHHLVTDGWYRKTYRSDGATEHINYIGDDSPVDGLLVALAASEVGAHWLLPYAYYCAATHTVAKLSEPSLMEGETRDCAIKALVTHTHLVSGSLKIWGCITAQRRCASTDRCNTIRASSLSDLVDLLSLNSALDPLHELDDDLDLLKTQGMCSDCFKDAEAKYHEAATMFWDEFPQLFGLEPWTQLDAMKRAALGEEAENSDEESESD
ncbi:BTB domain-containing protein [Favolaschia claudopus]|uniref:BTB domain-containing protein n=1 Tax=Favolaschia claudopus TaxID=2862362 RepID=A0AAW0B1P5_9AGAR